MSDIAEFDADAGAQEPVRTPWHLWVLGICHLIFALFAAGGTCMMRMAPDLYQETMSASQRAAHDAMPGWMNIPINISIFGGLLAALFLLRRSRLALPLYAASFVAGLVWAGWELSSGFVEVTTLNDMGLALVAHTLGLLMVAYAWAMKHERVLR